MISALAALVLATGPVVPGKLSLDVPPASSLNLDPGARLETPKSAWSAVGLTLACELPTLFFGPSCGHLYAGETTHFFLTGGLRVADLLALVALEQWGYGTPPLYAVLQPHFSRSLAAEPLAYSVDLVLVALWWGTGLYDLVDSLFVARRANRREALQRALTATPNPSGLTLAEF